MQLPRDGGGVELHCCCGDGCWPELAAPCTSLGPRRHVLGSADRGERIIAAGHLLPWSLIGRIASISRNRSEPADAARSIVPRQWAGPGSGSTQGALSPAMDPLGSCDPRGAVLAIGCARWARRKKCPVQAPTQGQSSSTWQVKAQRCKFKVIEA